VDDQQNSAAASGAGVVVVGSELAESGWVTVDLAAYDGLAARGAFAPRPARSEPAAFNELWRPQNGGEGEKALVKARLVAWAERLRTHGPDRGSEVSKDFAGLSPDFAPPARRIPGPDIVVIERRSMRARAAPVRLIAAPAGAASAPPAAPPKPRLFRSRGGRFLLLGMATAYLITGLVHSLARWKPSRVIVVPATIDGRTVIT
jgi:hypothetical protein